MTSASTATESVPAAGGPTEPPRPDARLGSWRVAAVVAVVLSIAAALLVQVPYYSISPGDARPLVAAVSVDGPSFTPEGSLFLTTVSVSSQRVTVLEALVGWLDPTVDVVEEEVIVPPDIDRSQVRELNLQMMRSSKEVALGVAFEALGVDAIRGEGAEIVQVLPDAPADGKLEAGDVIVGVDGVAVELHTDAIDVLASRDPGDRVTIAVRRAGAGAARDVEIELAANPEAPERALLGVTLRTKAERLHLPFAVDIATDEIGGPSAGLAITLEIIDVLTEGELTGGRKVAATGTIEPDGSVGEVGGVAQKAVAVEEAGIDLFLVPVGEVDEARRHAGDGLRVEGVSNLQDALRVLASIGGNGLALPKLGGA